MHSQSSDQWISHQLDPDYSEYTVYVGEPSSDSSRARGNSSSLSNSIKAVLINDDLAGVQQNASPNVDWRSDSYQNYGAYELENSQQRHLEYLQHGFPNNHQHHHGHDGNNGSGVSLSHHQQSAHQFVSSTPGGGGGMGYVEPSVHNSKVDLCHQYSNFKRLRPHSTPATLCWLDKNYELADGVCIPRNVVYFNYVDFCSKNNMHPVNAASFGKIIRQMFQNLTTRRLGTRGQSRYHYFGLAIKPDSIYYSPNYSNRKSEDFIPPQDVKLFTSKQHNPNQKFNSSIKGSSQMSSHSFQNNSSASSLHHSINSNICSSTNQFTHASGHSSTFTTVATMDQVDQKPLNSLVQFAAAQQLPNFPEIVDLNICGSSVIDSRNLQIFIDLYHIHCQKVLDVIKRFNFTEISTIFKNFWKELPDHLTNYLGDNVVITLIGVCDMILYRTLLKAVLPTCIQMYPENILKIIRKFSYDLVASLQFALKNMPETLVNVKMKLAKQLSKMIRRGTSVCHLYQTSSLVMSTAKCYQELAKDWKKVEMDTTFFEDICLKTCNDKLIQSYIDKFHAMMLEQRPISDVCYWMVNIIRHHIEHKSEISNIRTKAKKILGVWQAIGCKILKPLKKYGSESPSSGFHLMYLLLNEVILYEVEKSIFNCALRDMSPKILSAKPSELSEATCTDSFGIDFLSKSEEMVSPSAFDSHGSAYDLSQEPSNPPPLKMMKASSEKLLTSSYQPWMLPSQEEYDSTHFNLHESSSSTTEASSSQ